jgi:hypothetical protein
MQLDGRGGEARLEGLDIESHLHRLDVAQRPQAVRLAPVGEQDGGARVGPACVGVADMGGEELDEAPRSGLVRREQRGQGQPRRR